MPIKQANYRGMLIKAAAFEVVGRHRFIGSLLIAREGGTLGRAKLFEPPSEDGFFDDPEAALKAGVAFARAIIDGEVAGLTVQDL